MVLPDGQVETVSGLKISRSCPLLLEKGAKINMKDRQGRTPWQIAEKNRNTEIAELLRKHGVREGQ
jgi:ankyrin repeat protein